MKVRIRVIGLMVLEIIEWVIEFKNKRGNRDVNKKRLKIEKIR
jgi:hypothetical protein